MSYGDWAQWRRRSKRLGWVRVAIDNEFIWTHEDWALEHLAQLPSNWGPGGHNSKQELQQAIAERRAG